MAIQQCPQLQPQTASIYLTFKIFQVVNQLCRRLKPRVSGAVSPSLLGTTSSLGLESKARKTIAKGLSRVGPQERKQLHHASNGVCKSRKINRPSLKPGKPGQPNSVYPNTSGEEVQHMFRSLDGSIKAPNEALSVMAGDNNVFLKQNSSSHLEACSLNETIQYLVVIYDAINVLYAARSQYGDAWLITQGLDIGLGIDEVFIANYEHLLLCLQAQLIDMLARKVVEAMIENRSDKQNRRLLNWFTEFPNNQHPLNTTWPWSIKPSLAVLWGVCWMFYNPGPQNTKRGDYGVPQARYVHDDELRGWRVPQSDQADANFDLELTPQPAVQQSVGHAGGDLRVQNVSRRGTRSAEVYLSGETPCTRDELDGRSLSAYSDLACRSIPRPIIVTEQGCSTYWPAPQAYDHHYNSLHPDATHAAFATPHLYAYPVTLNSSLEPTSWPLPQLTLPQTTTLGHLTVPRVPGARVTESADNQGFGQFTQPRASSLNIYQPCAQQHTPQQMNINTNTNNHTFEAFTMGNCPPETSPIPPGLGPKHERTASINSNSNMPTPVSMSGPRTPLLSDEHRPLDDRSVSVAASVASSYGHKRHSSEGRSSDDGEDGESPRMNQAFKRSEDPPRNNDGKMICKHTQCANILFDRKCEWSKHMDKHDRPYKCSVKGCEKLQGFTYSGGLLRHEREVHKLHGGTKKSLFCPFTDCKRSSGAGFTRKENLAEHVRRVHRRTSMSVDMGNMIIARPLSRDNDTAELHLSNGSTYRRISEVREDDEEASLSLKRKRLSDSGMSDMHVEPDLRAEVKRLRRENEEKDARLVQLEEAVMVLQKSRQ